jgi:hypothetical protein
VGRGRGFGEVILFLLLLLGSPQCDVPGSILISRHMTKNVFDVFIINSEGLAHAFHTVGRG